MLIVMFIVFAGAGFAISALYPFRLIRLGVIAVGVLLTVIMRKKVINALSRLITTIKNKEQSV